MVKCIQRLFEKWPEPVMSNHGTLPYYTFFLKRCLAALATNGSCVAAHLQHRRIMPRRGVSASFCLFYPIPHQLGWNGHLIDL